jgi:D-glycero-beta-D-manno-heptose-7-phosphate kinase
MKRSKSKSATSSISVDLIALSEIVERFAAKTVIVLGDFVADAFQFGDITRVSREAPVLILRHRETQIVPGGGANAASNFASLGAKVLPVTAVGNDPAGDALVQVFRARKVDTSAILRVKGWTTPTKTRFLAGWTHTVGQQVLRVDYEPKEPLPHASRKKLQGLFAKRIRKGDAIAISDYGFGVARPDDVRRISSMVRANIPLTLDSRYRLTDYTKAGITAATPNEAELEALHHSTIGQNRFELERCGETTRVEMKLHSLLVTRGKDGMAIFQAAQSPIHIPVHGSDQAVDVTGAGDTVLAAYTLALASGASPLEAAHVANIAGGLVVMKRGTATVSRDELLQAIHDATSEAAT